MPTFVIVGAGLAGAKAAETLRAEGFDGDIVLIGAEPERPYERPPLSKGLLLGAASRDSAFVHEPDWYAGHDVELRTDTVVESLDRRRRQLDPGRRRAARLRPRCCWPPAPGRAPSRCRAPTWTACCTCVPSPTATGWPRPPSAGARLVIIGAGWIGLEVAAAARQRGASVTVVEHADAAAAAGPRRPDRRRLRRPAPRARRRVPLRYPGGRGSPATAGCPRWC